MQQINEILTRMPDAGYWLILAVSLFLSISTGAYVKKTYAKFGSVPVSSDVTANDFAQKMLRDNGIYDVALAHTSGELTDNYNHRALTLSLSDSTYGKSSVAAVGVAAHEAGHAVQYKKRYLPVLLRSGMAGVVNVGSNLGLILAVVGSLFNSAFGDALITVGLVLYSAVFLFTLVTLPVEFNASRRAISAARASGFFSSKELAGMRSVLTAAALTYVASMTVALLNLLRMISIFGGGRRRN